MSQTAFSQLPSNTVPPGRVPIPGRAIPSKPGEVSSQMVPPVPRPEVLWQTQVPLTEKLLQDTTWTIVVIEEGKKKMIGLWEGVRFGNGVCTRTSNGNLRSETGTWSIKNAELLINIKKKTNEMVGPEEREVLQAKSIEDLRQGRDITLEDWFVGELGKSRGPAVITINREEIFIELTESIEFKSKKEPGYRFRLVQKNEKSVLEQLTKEEFTPSLVTRNPCNDKIASRLLDERYSEQLRERLEDLKKNGITLQPLGDREEGNLFTTGLPFANFDRYAVTIPKERIPLDFDPSAELANLGKNMNAVPKPGSQGSQDLNNTNTFSVANKPLNEGDVINISIAGYPRLGFAGDISVPVIVTASSPSSFRVSTATRDIGQGVGFRHPVSGSREFGFIRNQNGSITFYTQGVDSPTSWLAQWIGSRAQKKGWEGLMRGFAERFGFSDAEAAKLVALESFSNNAIESSPECYKPFYGQP